MKKSKLFPLCTVILCAVLVLSACGGGSTPATSGDSQPSDSASGSAGAAGETIKIFVAGPMTGDSANLGYQQRSGAEMAVEEINAAGGAGGVMLELEIGDDQANPNQASLLAEKIISQDEVLAVNGHVNSGCSLSGLPIYERASVPVISPTNTSDTICDEGYGNYYRIIASDRTNVEQQVYMAIVELGCSQPAMIWENTDYGKGMRDVALQVLEEDFGITPVGDESYVAGTDRDYSAQVTKFKGAGADVVLFMGEYTAGALFAKQNVSLGLNAYIVTGNGCSHPGLIEIAGEDAEGVYVMTCYDPSDPREKQAAFTKKFTENYGEEPGEWAAHSYDTVYLIKEAYENGGTTRETLMEELFKLSYEGVTGLIEFNEKGDVPNKRVSVMKVEDGQFNTYIPEKY